MQIGLALLFHQVSHIYVLTYDICVSLSDSLHSVFLIEPLNLYRNLRGENYLGSFFITGESHTHVSLLFKNDYMDYNIYNLT